jgi:transposase-like protein
MPSVPSPRRRAYTYVWMDALVLKCREAGRIVNIAAVVATAVNSDGHRGNPRFGGP